MPDTTKLNFDVHPRRVDAHGSETLGKDSAIVLDTDLAGRRDAFNPAEMLPAVRALLASLPGVAQVSDLHVWAMGTDETALTTHPVMPAGGEGDAFPAHAPSNPKPAT